MNNFQKLLRQQEEPIDVIYVSSYIPRKCGIATYTKDLTNSINLLNSRSLAEVLTITREDEVIEYPWESKFKIISEDLSTYLGAADYVNHSHANLVVLQHEFGLYGGECGEYILPFVESLKKPLITTFHTVLPDVDDKHAEILRRIAKKSEAIIVMMEDVAHKLINQYQIPRKKIVVIPHGVPDLPFNTVAVHKKKKRLTDRLVLGNINLLDPNKGLEYALEAVAKIKEKYPHVLYTIIGQTHPDLLRKEGEKYRNFLKRRVRELGIVANVRFVNKYLSLDELTEWLKSLDIYVTPYLDPRQVTSGALAYAIGAGKACISTPYIYAQEVLADDRGLLVPFRDSQAIAEAVIELVENPAKQERLERNAYQFGRLMTWPNVAHRHLMLFRNVLAKIERRKQRAIAESARTLAYSLVPSAQP